MVYHVYIILFIIFSRSIGTFIPDFWTIPLCSLPSVPLFLGDLEALGFLGVLDCASAELNILGQLKTMGHFGHFYHFPC
jgi:hypothetical protein